MEWERQKDCLAGRRVKRGAQGFALLRLSSVRSSEQGEALPGVPKLCTRSLGWVRSALHVRHGRHRQAPGVLVAESGLRQRHCPAGPLTNQFVSGFCGVGRYGSTSATQCSRPLSSETSWRRRDQGERRWSPPNSARHTFLGRPPENRSRDRGDPAPPSFAYGSSYSLASARVAERALMILIFSSSSV